MKRTILLATVMALTLLTTGSAHRANDQDSCGKVFTYKGYKLLKVRKMSCYAAQDVGHDYERKAFSGADPDTGDVERVRRFECTWKQYFDPSELAYECRHTRQDGKVLKAFHPPTEG